MTAANNAASYQNQNLVVAPTNKVLTTNASIPGARDLFYCHSRATLHASLRAPVPSPIILSTPGVVSDASSVSNACTADGTTQQVTLTIPSAIPGAIGYSVWMGTAQFGTVSLSCANPGITGLSGILLPKLRSKCSASPNRWSRADVRNHHFRPHPLVTGYQDFLQQASAPVNPSAGYCRSYFDAGSGTMKGINSTGAACTPSGGGGTVNNASQYSGVYYSAAGTNNQLSGDAAPTTNGFWKRGYNVTAGAAVAPASYLEGLGNRSITGATATDPVTFADNGTVIIHDVGCSHLNNETLPTATTLGNAKFGFAYTNHCPGYTDTITPTTWTIQNGSAAAGASISVASGVKCLIQVDPNSTTNWLADCTLTSSDATTINGGTVPTSAPVIGTNGSQQPVASTAHNIGTPLLCADSSGSGTAQSCTTTPTFTPAAGDTILYQTTTTNTGALSINVNSTSAVFARKWQGVSNLDAGDLNPNVYQLATYDGTFWEFYTIGNAPLRKVAGGANALNTASIASAACNTTTVSATGVLTTDVIEVTINGTSYRRNRIHPLD